MNVDIYASCLPVLLVLAQVECGAQVIQIFDSWAHHLSEDQFSAFAKVTNLHLTGASACTNEWLMQCIRVICM